MMAKPLPLEAVKYKTDNSKKNSQCNLSIASVHTCGVPLRYAVKITLAPDCTLTFANSHQSRLLTFQSNRTFTETYLVS